MLPQSEPTMASSTRPFTPMPHAALRLSDFGLPSAFGFRPSDFPKALSTLAGPADLRALGPRPAPAPHIGYVYPAGGRQGAMFQVAVGGQYLNNATNAYVSGAGVQAVVVEYYPASDAEGVQ